MMHTPTVRLGFQRSVAPTDSSGVLLDLVDAAEDSATQDHWLALRAPNLLWDLVYALVRDSREFFLWVPHDSSLSEAADRRPLFRDDLNRIRRLVVARATDPRSYPLSFWILDSRTRWESYTAIDAAHDDRTNSEAMNRAIRAAECRVAVFRSSITVSFAEAKARDTERAVESVLETVQRSQAVSIIRDA